MKLKSLLRTRLRNVRLGALGLLLSTTACAAAIVDPAAPASEPTDASGREVARSADGASGQTVQAQSSATLAANAMQGEEPQIRSQSRVDVPQAGPTGGQQSGSRDNIFWLFSSSAQAISAFIAFLVTGYIFALTAMEGLEKADETLAEIHFELKKEYHSRLTALSVLTGCAIISSLTAVYANGFEFAYRGVLFCATAAVDLGAIIGGLLFVTSIVNPERYKKAAKAQIREKFASTAPEVPVAAFVTEFIQLEKLVRTFLSQRQMATQARSAGFAPFREMLETLMRSEVIDRNLFKRLERVNNYRNLVVHGNIDEVDSGMLQALREDVRDLRAALKDPPPTEEP